MSLRRIGLAAVLLAGGLAGAALGAGAEDLRALSTAELLRRAAAAAPGTPAARVLSAEIGRRGEDLRQRGEAGSAIELLGEAYALDERNGAVLAELTLAYVAVEDMDSARFYLRRAEELGAAGAPPEVYAGLGNLYRALHRLDDAAAAWGEAVRLGGQDPEMLAALSRLRDEIAVSRGQRTLSTEHFAVFADPDLPEATVAAAAAALEHAVADLAARLDVDLSRPQIAVLHAGRDYFSLVSVPDWVAGVYDGKIRVSVEASGGDPNALAGVLAHELAHGLLRAASRDGAPAWFHEGFAQWSEGRRAPRSELRAALAGRSAPASFGALDAALRGKLDRRAARAAYVQALSLVEFLERAYGSGAIRCVVRALAEGVGLDAALRAETGLGESELFADWRRWAGI